MKSWVAAILAITASRSFRRARSVLAQWAAAVFAGRTKKIFMSMFLFNALFASALFAKDLEFEFEALDFYDPLTPNLEKREWLDNLSIEGVYEKKAERLKWRAPDRRGAAGFHRRNES